MTQLLYFILQGFDKMQFLEKNAMILKEKLRNILTIKDTKQITSCYTCTILPSLSNILFADDISSVSAI